MRAPVALMSECRDPADSSSSSAKGAALLPFLDALLLGAAVSSPLKRLSAAACLLEGKTSD